MIAFKIFNTVVCHLDLFFNYRDTSCKIIMRSHLTCKLLNLCVSYRLRRFKLMLNFIVRAVVIDDNTDKSEPADDY